MRRTQAIIRYERQKSLAGEEQAGVLTFELVTADETAAVEHDQDRHRARRRRLARGLGPIHVEPMTRVGPISEVAPDLDPIARLRRQQRRVDLLRRAHVEHGTLRANARRDPVGRSAGHDEFLCGIEPGSTGAVPWAGGAVLVPPAVAASTASAPPMTCGSTA